MKEITLKFTRPGPYSFFHQNKWYKENDEIKIKADENNIPLDPFWRSQLKDNELDKFMEIITSDSDVIATNSNPKNKNASKS